MISLKPGSLATNKRKNSRIGRSRSGSEDDGSGSNLGLVLHANRTRQQQCGLASVFSLGFFPGTL